MSEAGINIDKFRTHLSYSRESRHITEAVTKKGARETTTQVPALGTVPSSEMIW